MDKLTIKAIIPDSRTMICELMERINHLTGFWLVVEMFAVVKLSKLQIRQEKHREKQELWISSGTRDAHKQLWCDVRWIGITTSLFSFQWAPQSDLAAHTHTGCVLYLSDKGATIKTMLEKYLTSASRSERWAERHSQQRQRDTTGSSLDRRVKRESPALLVTTS